MHQIDFNCVLIDPSFTNFKWFCLLCYKFSLYKSMEPNDKTSHKIEVGVETEL